MSNHIVSALLAGTLEMRTSEEIKKSLLERALALGDKSDDDDGTLVEKEESYYRRTSKAALKRFIKMDPESLFTLPDSYQKAMEKYKAEKEVIDKQLRELQLQFDTIQLKVEIGSGKHLEALVMQVDSLGSLDLISNKLLLGATEEEVKRLKQ